jgi:type 1 glutamine amidotransferase
MAKLATLALALAAALAAPLLASPTAADAPTLRVLLFTKTAAYRHTSIPQAVQAIRQLGNAHGFAVDATEDAAAFSDDNLRRYDVVAFVLTTGDVLDAAEQASFERFVRAGGGFVGVHSAADTEYGWPWYGGLVGAYFRDHPQIQRAAIDVTLRTASTARLPARWARTDEWYNFASDPSARVEVLARLDERTYEPGAGAMGAAHPIAWTHAYEGGRAWYTGGGHTSEAYDEPLFRAHLLGGILTAAGYGMPRPASLTTAVRARRVEVAVRPQGCFRCAGRVRVRVNSRWTSTALTPSGALLRGRSPTLPAGRTRIQVVLSETATGLSTTTARTVTVRRP